MAENRLDIIINLIKDEANRALDQFSNDMAELRQETEKTSSGFTDFQSKVVTLNQAADLAGKAFRVASQAGEAFISAINKGQEVENLSNSFENLQASVGKVADESLASFQTATLGLVSNLDLMKASNQAVLLGLPTEGFNEAAGAAIAFGRSVGENAKTSLDSFIDRLNGSKSELEETYGITLDSELANRKYADSLGIASTSLTEQQEKLALQQQAYQRLTEKSEDLGQSQDTAGIAIQRLSSQLENQKNEFFQAIANSTDLGSAINDMATEFANVDTETLANALTGIARVAVEVVVPSINAAITAIDLLFNAGERLSGFTKITNDIQSASQEGVAQAANTINEIQRNVDSLNLSAEKSAGLFKNGLGNAIKDAGRELKKTQATIKGVYDQIERNGKRNLNNAKLITEIKELEQVAGKQAQTFSALNNQQRETVKIQDALAGKYGDTTEASKKIEEALTKIGDASGVASGGLAGTAGASGKTAKAVKEANKVVDEYAKSLESLGDSVLQLAPVTEEFKRVERAASELFKSQEAGLITNDQFKDTLVKIAKEAGLSTVEIDKLRQSVGGLNSATESSGTFLDGLFGGFKGEGISDGIAEEIGAQIQRGLGDAATSILNAENSEDYKETFSQLGATAGQAFGAQFGPAGAAIGKVLGEKLAGDTFNVGNAVLNGGNREDIRQSLEDFGFGGKIFGEKFASTAVDVLTLGLLGGKDEAANARGAFQRFIDDITEDAGFEGKIKFFDGKDSFQLPDGRNAFDAITDDFGNATTRVQQEIDGLGIPPELLSKFQGLGTAFSEAFDFGDGALASQIGDLLAVNFKNPAGLNDLQVLLKQAKVDAESLQVAIEDAYLNGDLAAGEFLNSSAAINDLYEKGIPGAIGAADVAVNNFVKSIEKGGAFSQDSLADIASEARKVGVSFAELPAYLESLGVSTKVVDDIFSEFVARGIDTIQELENIDIFDTASIVDSLGKAGFAFDKTKDDIASLNAELDKIPESKDIDVKIRVQTEARDSAAQDFLDSGSIGLQNQGIA